MLKPKREKGRKKEQKATKNTTKAAAFLF